EIEYATEKPLYEKGKELIRQGNLEEGIAILEESAAKEKSQLDSTYSLIGQSYFKLKQWDKALLSFEKSMEIRSFNSEILFYASYSAKMDKKLLKASELGERCYLRDPSNSKNLVNLADIYKRMNKLDRAIHLVNKALSEEPNNRNALRLKELLEV
ncbi:MAG: tetratricopeptide repeat protein, partial [Leptospira sp.]|nr:tetratricopeptide repeat protein [Leptospira sp.]